MPGHTPSYGTYDCLCNIDVQSLMLAHWLMPHWTKLNSAPPSCPRQPTSSCMSAASDHELICPRVPQVLHGVEMNHKS